MKYAMGLYVTLLFCNACHHMPKTLHNFATDFFRRRYPPFHEFMGVVIWRGMMY
jgi:hypothetical protein